jgi:hypothetical protein
MDMINTYGCGVVMECGVDALGDEWRKTDLSVEWTYWE